MKMGNGHSPRFGGIWLGMAGLLALLIVGFALKPILFAVPDAGFVTVDEAMRRMLQEQSGAEAGTGKAEDGKAEAQKAEAQKAEDGKAPSGPGAGTASEALKPAEAEKGKPNEPANDAPEGAKKQLPSAGTDPGAAQPAPGASGGKLNLNLASADQLDALPGIGPSRAQAIIELRSKLGGSFRSVDQLGEVKGIGEKTLNKLKPLVTVGTE